MKVKVGLLVCDQVKSQYLDKFGDYPKMFQILFPDYEFVCYNVFQGKFPNHVDDCPVYMSTGSAHSAYEDLPWIKKTKAFIKKIAESNSYFIGFCFGHQLMAEALGGKVEKASVGWCVGIHEYSIHHLKSWMRPAKTSVNFLMMCQDQVIKLPANAIRIAGSPDCPNAILQVGKRILSIQGHPEFSKAYDKILMESRVEKMGQEKVTKGINSLTKDIDTALFRQWVDNFISGH